ncbi:MAG: glycosyltransferase [Verrucomicrobiia bacterium]
MISAIVPTYHRPASLRRLLEALAQQTVRPDEVIVANAGEVPVPEVGSGLVVREVRCREAHAVRQRMAAIQEARGDWLLLLDDDVVPETDCVRRLMEPLWGDSGLVATTASFSNHDWSRPTWAWRAYLCWCYGVRRDEEVQGRVLGPLLRFGYFDEEPGSVRPMEWLGAGNSCVRRSAFEAVGGFSDFFLHRSTLHEDVDLGLRLRRLGRIGLCRHAKMAHEQASSGRLDPALVAEDDLYNRFQVLHRTMGLSRQEALGLVRVYDWVEGISHVVGRGLWRDPKLVAARWLGRRRAWRRLKEGE